MLRKICNSNISKISQFLGYLRSQRHLTAPITLDNIDNAIIQRYTSYISPAGVSWRARDDDDGDNNACAARGQDYRFRRGGCRRGDEERVNVAAPVRQPGIDSHRPRRRGAHGVTSWRRVYANEGPHRIASRT